MPENMVEGISEIAAIDQPQAQENNNEALSSLLTETVQQPEQAAENDTNPPAKEPGWIKGRIDKAVSKAVADTESRIRAEYEAMLAPIRESVLDRQAEELVNSGEFKSLDRAKEYVRMKNNLPVQQEAPKQEQPRDNTGRFAPKQENAVDPVLQARADLLAQQAEKIKTARGLDVMQALNEDAEIKQRVLSGEWDFYDVAEQLAQQPRRNAPPAVRKSNGVGAGGQFSIANMTKEQFAKLQENLAKGHRYDLTK